MNQSIWVQYFHPETFASETTQTHRNAVAYLLWNWVDYAYKSVHWEFSSWRLNHLSGWTLSVCSNIDHFKVNNKIGCHKERSYTRNYSAGIESLDPEQSFWAFEVLIEYYSIWNIWSNWNYLDSNTFIPHRFHFNYIFSKHSRYWFLREFGGCHIDQPGNNLNFFVVFILKMEMWLFCGASTRGCDRVTCYFRSFNAACL